MTWRPASLLEAPEIDFPARRPGRTRCPTCGVFRPRAVIVDVRGLPIPEDWACDVCWTGWQRTGRVIDGGFPLAAGDARARHMEWRRRWVIVLDAPAEVVRKLTEQPS